MAKVKCKLLRDVGNIFIFILNMYLLNLSFFLNASETLRFQVTEMAQRTSFQKLRKKLGPFHTLRERPPTNPSPPPPDYLTSE